MMPDDSHDARATNTEMRRVSTILGERLCVACGFNLHGQPVLQEPVYSMFIVRCPECATCAAVQEYPSIGKWSRRWTVALIALWLGVLAIGAFATAGIVTGINSATLLNAGRQYAVEIATTFLESKPGQAYIQSRQGGSTGLSSQFTPEPWTAIDGVWWKDYAGKDEVFARSGGYGAMAGAIGMQLFGVAVTMMTMGVIVSGLMPHLRGIRFVVPAVLWAVIAGLFGWLVVHETTLAFRQTGSWIPAQQHAVSRIAPPIVAIGVVWGAAMLFVGLLAGRPILRWLACALVPPRLRVGLSALWICDGKQPPSRRVVTAPRRRRSA